MNRMIYQFQFFPPSLSCFKCYYRKSWGSSSFLCENMICVKALGIFSILMFLNFSIMCFFLHPPYLAFQDLPNMIYLNLLQFQEMCMIISSIISCPSNFSLPFISQILISLKFTYFNFFFVISIFLILYMRVS